MIVINIIKRSKESFTCYAAFTNQMGYLLTSCGGLLTYQRVTQTADALGCYSLFFFPQASHTYPTTSRNTPDMRLPR